MFRAVVTLLIWAALMPLTVHAHPFDNPQAVMVLEGIQSGIYTVSASQLATAEQTHLDVQLTLADGTLPGDVRVVVMATDLTSPDSDATHAAPLERSDDTFSGDLPAGVDWTVDLLIYGSRGDSTVSLTVNAYRETPPLVRNLTFIAPAILMIIALFAFKKFDITLTQ